MLKILIFFFVVFLVLVSGCIQEKTVSKNIEDEAINQIEKELEEAIQNITTEDIEKAIAEINI